jgi:heme/copper-type cytochrome/quinol oxidase subunit 3
VSESARALSHEASAHAAHQHEAVEHTRFGVWVWLASECAFFASLIGTYLAMHGHFSPGLGPKQLFDLKTTAVSTFALLISSVTMGLVVEAAQRQAMPALRLWLVVTALLGLVFVGMEAREFLLYWHKGLTLSSSAFGSAFFTLVGFHGLHVSFGIAWILSLLIYSFRKRGGLEAADLWRFEVASLYWYFVDVVWVVLFTVVYLLGKLG